MIGIESSERITTVQFLLKEKAKNLQDGTFMTQSDCVLLHSLSVNNGNTFAFLTAVITNNNCESLQALMYKYTTCCFHL